MVCTSTAEAEIHAVMDMLNTVRGTGALLQELFEKMFQKVDAVALILSDSQPGLDAVQAKRARKKHYDVKVKHIAEAVERGEVKLQKIATSANIADVFTKALRAVRFRALTRFFMCEP